MRLLFRFKKKEDETLARCCSTARAARTIWTRMKLYFQSETIAEGKWRAMGRTKCGFDDTETRCVARCGGKIQKKQST